MQVLTKHEVNAHIEQYKRGLKDCIFVYPTDTIYGIGCDALNGVLVDKVQDLKGRMNKACSIIAPSKDWIREHCIVTEEGEKWLEKLPGPYTLIFKIKPDVFFPDSLTQGKETIGIRIPEHWIATFVQQMGTPIVSTSANRAGENHMVDADDLPVEWRTEVKYLIYEGERRGTPSTLVYLDEDEPKIQER